MGSLLFDFDVGAMHFTHYNYYDPHCKGELTDKGSNMGWCGTQQF